MLNKIDAWCDKNPKAANAIFAGLVAFLGGYVIMTCLNVGLARMGY